MERGAKCQGRDGEGGNGPQLEIGGRSHIYIYRVVVRDVLPYLMIRLALQKEKKKGWFDTQIRCHWECNPQFQHMKTQTDITETANIRMVFIP